MKILSILLLLTVSLLWGGELQTKEPQKSLEAISKYAVKIGSGNESDVYIFVDPMCQYSKKLIKKLHENKIIQLANTYYIFLYRLPKFDSTKMMQYILEASDQKEALIDIMVHEEPLDLEGFEAKEQTKAALEAISDVAKTLDMTKRPYMISFEKGSAYCRVSEGTASCLEELK